METKWVCKNCGELNINEDIKINGFDQSIVKNNLGIDHIFPVCIKCNSSIELHCDDYGIKNVFLLNGTCGSGKTTISKYLNQKDDKYLIIDGDRVIEILKYKMGIKYKYNIDELYSEILSQIIIGIALGKIIIINYIFSVIDYNKFKEKVIKKNIKPKMIILKPDMEIAYKRTQERTGFANKTEKKWVEYFDKMMDEYKNTNEKIIDNGNLTIEETIKIIEKEINE